MWKLKYKSFNDSLLLLCNYYCIEIEFDSTQCHMFCPLTDQRVTTYNDMTVWDIFMLWPTFVLKLKKNILLQSFKLLIIFHFIFDVYQRIAIECEVVGFTILLSKRNNATTLKKKYDLFKRYINSYAQQHIQVYSVTKYVLIFL